MSDHADVADSVLKFSQRRIIFGGILDWLRDISRVVNSVIGYSSVLLNPSRGRSLFAMASVDPIDISSTDNDSDFWEIDNYRAESPDRDVTSSINPRSLTTWTSSSHPNSTDYTSVSMKSPYSSSSTSSKRKVVHDDIQLRPLEQLDLVDAIGPSTFKVNGNVHQRFGSSSDGGYDTSCEMIYSQAKKRTISAGLQTSISGTGRTNPVDNVGASEIRETFGRFNQLGTWSHASNGRQLPLSLIPGQKPSTTPYVGLNDSFHHTELGEEGRARADERFVFQAAVQDLHQPKVEATLPDGLLTVSLLRHQKIALAWMLNKESSGLCLGGILADDQGLGKTVSMIALMQMQKTVEAESKSKCNSRTEALNLDDDEGNGGCVALDDPGQIDGSGEYTILPEANNAFKGFQSRRPTAGTLIVCPASVIRQWARELREKVYYKAKLQVLTYHGGNRTKDPAVLAENDVVLTTYAIVTNEVPKQPLVDEDDDVQNDEEPHGLSSAFSMEKKRKKSSCNKKHKKGKREIDVSTFDSNCGTLAKVKWSRVVLDESQMIKNHRTQVARACCSLRAKRRWCLSGTPMQNSVDELFSYFRFLRYDPYDKYKTFGSSIKGLIARDSAKGYKKLQVVLRNIMLRRTKGTLIDGEPIITLPPKQIYLTRVEFSLEERAFYDKLESDSRKQFKAYAAAGTVNQNYANILLMLLRLRQACDHPLLVKGLSSDPVGKVSSEMAKILPRELLVNLWKNLETSLAICLACRDPPENAVVTMCGHVFCYQCVSDHLTGEDNTCPAPECKEQLGADVVYSRSTLRTCLSDYIDGDANVSLELDEKCSVLRRDYISSKIRRALDILKSHCISKCRSSESHDLIRYHGDASSSSGVLSSSESGGRGKAIVFSQWTSMLDLVEMSLKNSRITYRRLDGTMSIAARDKAVKDFNTDPEVDVMLMSLKAGNLGLNMVAACRIILLDLWWNPTTEDQAIDRAHRIGQTRPVTVSRITIKDTVEDRILTLQEDKRKMVASAFGEDQTGGHGSRLTVDDLRFLFEGSEAARR